MFAINHAAAALVLKRRYPTVRIVVILLAVQAVELIWVVLNLVGVETTTTDSTVRSVQNIHLVHMPWSHSIATTIALAVVSWTLIRFWKTKDRDCRRTRHNVSPPAGPRHPQS